MATPIDKKRNVAVIAHRGAGKTTLVEDMLFNAGVITRPGRVEDENSVFDFEDEEHKRKISISTAIHHYEHNKHFVDIIDTPGYSNFLSDTKASVSVADGAILLLSAISGIKVQTEQVWGYCEEFGVPRIAFVNKMDRENADHDTAVHGMEDVFGVRGVALQLPIGQGVNFSGLVDLVTMKARYYPDDLHGSVEVKEIPDDLKEEAESARDALMEVAAESCDQLTEKYLEEGFLTDAELCDGIRKAVLARDIVPILLGSALKNIGVDLLTDSVDAYLPGPDRIAEVSGETPEGEPATRKVCEDAPFSARVFKTVIDPFTGKLSYLKIFSGTLTGETQMHNTSTDTREKVGHIFMIEGKKTSEVKCATAGDIIALAKLKDTHTGDTLCATSDKIIFDSVKIPPSLLSFAVTPKTKSDEDKVPVGLSKMMEEDPSLDFHRDDETHEFILSGTGQVHLEVAVERLKRKFGCEVELKSPRIPYKETIRRGVKTQGKYKKQSGGRGQYGDAWIEVAPLVRGGGFEFEDAIVGGAIPRQYIPAVEKGVKEAMGRGALGGFPVVDVRVKLYDGSYHNVDSSEMAFKIAASMGFRKAMEDAAPVILEPLMDMEIIVPDDHMGDVIGDLNSKRGKVQGVESKGSGQIIKACVPMSEVINYANDLKGITGDRGMFTMEFSHYEELPAHLVAALTQKTDKS